jgi:Flp pilus assembly protein TadG
MDTNMDLTSHSDLKVAVKHRPFRHKNLFGRWRRNTEGATAIEFAFVAAPFFALMFAIIETALVFFSGQVLQTAVTDASRSIFTGNAAGWDEAEFKKQVCLKIPALFDCNALLKIDVRGAGKLFDASATPSAPPITPATGSAPATLDTTGFGYAPPGSGQIVIVRAFVEYPIYVAFLNPTLPNVGSNKRLLMATYVAQNEPF